MVDADEEGMAIGLGPIERKSGVAESAVLFEIDGEEFAEVVRV